MNIDLKQFRDLRAKFNRKGLLARTETIRPMRHWAIAFGVTTALFVSGSAYLGYDFYVHLVEGDEEWQGTTPVPAEYRQSDAQAILKLYRSRQAEFERLRGEQNMYSVASEGGEVAGNQADGNTLAEQGEEQYSSATTTDEVVE